LISCCCSTQFHDIGLFTNFEDSSKSDDLRKNFLAEYRDLFFFFRNFDLFTNEIPAIRAPASASPHPSRAVSRLHCPQTPQEKRPLLSATANFYISEVQVSRSRLPQDPQAEKKSSMAQSSRRSKPTRLLRVRSFICVGVDLLAPHSIRISVSIYENRTDCPIKLNHPVLSNQTFFSLAVEREIKETSRDLRSGITLGWYAVRKSFFFFFFEMGESQSENWRGVRTSAGVQNAEREFPWASQKVPSLDLLRLIDRVYCFVLRTNDTLSD
jgi:hypothetical protein